MHKLTDLNNLETYLNTQKKNIDDSILVKPNNKDILNLNGELIQKYTPGSVSTSGATTISSEGIATTFTTKYSRVVTKLTNQVLANDWEIQIKFKLTDTASFTCVSLLTSGYYQWPTTEICLANGGHLYVGGFTAEGNAHATYPWYNRNLRINWQANKWYILRLTYDGINTYSVAVMNEDYSYIPTTAAPDSHNSDDTLIDIYTKTEAKRFPMNRTDTLCFGCDVDFVPTGNPKLFIDLAETYIKGKDGKLISSWNL